MTISLVSEKGQITLPAAARRKLGIEPRSTVQIEATEDAIIIRPTADLFALAGFAGKALSPKQEKAALHNHMKQRSRSDR